MVVQDHIIRLLSSPPTEAGRSWHRCPPGDRLPGFTGPAPSTTLDKRRAIHFSRISDEDTRYGLVASIRYRFLMGLKLLSPRQALVCTIN